MNDVVIRAEGLGKKYLIGHQSRGERYTALRDVLVQTTRGFARSLRDMAQGRQLIQGDEVEEFWALKEVNFEIARGEVVGIIGRNGAGKSTMLKILSRITEPSAGRVEIRGRIASLLEVGTGFHPELTGRENIHLNGSILGMSRAEIRRKFDEIVTFAEVERFLDTPVKHYSSGMYVRLAFAIAAHLEPEILVVDEVLAVGDVEFRKKCMGKMQDIAGHGRTVLFVSHDVAALRALCGRALLLSNGTVTYDGDVETALSRYSSAIRESYEILFDGVPERPAITAVRVSQQALKNGDFILEMDFASPTPLSPVIGGVVLRSPQGNPVWGSNGRFHPAENSSPPQTVGTMHCEAKLLPLLSGSYAVSVWLGDWHTDYDQKVDILSISLGPDNEVALRPSPTLIGSLDWPAAWSASLSRREKPPKYNIMSSEGGWAEYDK
jgi:lipopolysaccharide transport system ATP-binding protein